MTSNSIIEPKVYEPFPDGDHPDGWPPAYVSLVDYRSARDELDRQRAEVERLTRELREEQELVEINLSRMRERALAYMREGDRLRAALTDWLRTFGSTDTLSIRTRALLNVQPADASASERCHFRAFGSLPCEKPKGHDGDHVCKWPETAPSVDAEDAAKWRALRNCARITAMGSAGLGDDKAAEDYGHVTLNFWTGVDDVDRGPEYARDWLDKFVEKALRAKVSRPAAAGLATGSTDQPAPETIVSPQTAREPPLEQRCRRGHVWHVSFTEWRDYKGDLPMPCPICIHQGLRP